MKIYTVFEAYAEKNEAEGFFHELTILGSVNDSKKAKKLVDDRIFSAFDSEPFEEVKKEDFESLDMMGTLPLLGDIKNQKLFIYRVLTSDLLSQDKIWRYAIVESLMEE